MTLRIGTASVLRRFLAECCSRAFCVCAYVIATPLETKEIYTLGWALTSPIVAPIAGVLGFSGIAGTAAGIAETLRIIFMILLVLAMLALALRGRSPL